VAFRSRAAVSPPADEPFPFQWAVDLMSTKIPPPVTFPTPVPTRPSAAAAPRR